MHIRIGFSEFKRRLLALVIVMGNMEENPTVEEKQKPKATMTRKMIASTSVIIAVIILLAYLLGPGWSQIDSTEDFDGDGRADAYDVFPHDPMNWTWGYSNITFILDHDLLVNKYGMDSPIYHNSTVNYTIIISGSRVYFNSNGSTNIAPSILFTKSGTMTDSSVSLNCTFIFPSGIKNWTEVVYSVGLDRPSFIWLGVMDKVDAFAGRSSTFIFDDFGFLY
jgi:hypothetical protein